MASRTLLLLPGDGIGPEIMREARRVLDFFRRRRGIDIDISEGLVGGAAYDKYGAPIDQETLARAGEADAVLLGAVGGYKWDELDFAVRPEQGLLRLRKELDLYANLRPALCFSELVSESSLKPEIVSGLDLIVVRELVGGVYFGEPRGIETLKDGSRRAFNTQIYTTREIRRIAKVAFELAGKRQGRVCSVEKSNVMESGQLWREEVCKLHEEQFSDIELSHMYADNCAMQLVRYPKQFDVILTDNLFGDLLSDVAAMLTGSLGMLPSASLGEADANGKRSALYEPVHGSAPDIEGKKQANPIAMLMSLAMAFRYSFDLDEEATLLEEAIRAVLAGGLRTADLIREKGKAVVSTPTMGEAIVAKLSDRLAGRHKS